jgi:hypothetical protein
MRFLVFLIAAILLVLPSAGLAQEIHGRLWVSPGNIPAASAQVHVKCDPDFKKTATADKRGLYRLVGPGRAMPCTVTVTYSDKPSRPVRIYLSASRTKVDFELQGREDPSWSLIRR